MSWQADVVPTETLGNNNPFAPWNREEVEEEPQVCARCSAEVEDGPALDSKREYGDVLCDHCLVASSELGGDWSAIDIAAAVRIGVPHPDEPTC